jgi:hypothetical protein
MGGWQVAKTEGPVAGVLEDPKLNVLIGISMQ